ncbi:DUF2202 domain-containing protein [Thermococcus gorgonarius]|uniref:DUF2202 domain-containing protein n=1 Tax=Thermococcus gorgonarius TaxID=71997 RepID=A0A2Z2M426_THEGO|nr:DUF2202 domain-containing protein [Thermococcus gorgonarius]ASJ00590.1 hypothetical protein A3K92_03420 [Thermococcus gorgonarius]
MKRLSALIVVALVLGAVIVGGCITGTETGTATPSGGPPEDRGYGQKTASSTGTVDVSTLPAENLSPDEVEGILYMREEEKLARDVYLTLYNATGLKIFENIARSEQTHMDMVLQLIEKYNLTDPAEGKAVGEFTNPELQALYDQLVSRGETSDVEALKVGALIEEVDIKDLEEWLSRTDNEDIRLVFKNLMAGSENHLRAFTRTLANSYGVEYSPQVLSVERYRSIIES